MLESLMSRMLESELPAYTVIAVCFVWLLRQIVVMKERDEKQAIIREDKLYGTNAELRTILERHSNIIERQGNLLEQQTDCLVNQSEKLAILANVVDRLKEEVQDIRDDVTRFFSGSKE